MQTIENAVYGGERPLFASHGLKIIKTTVTDGESAIKEGSDIEALNCEFRGKYPFWHISGLKVTGCTFRPGARAAIWYTQHMLMRDSLIEAPKMFRDAEDLLLENVEFTDALETLWHCRKIVLKNVSVKNGDYLCMHSTDIIADHLTLQGNYAFQYCDSVTIRNSVLDTKDSFWETENVLLENCVVNGEYVAWHSRGCTFRDCRFSGTQPFCYAQKLRLERCSFAADADLAFEYSDVEADIAGHLTSVKNPLSGHISAGSIGDIIIDENLKQPGNCVISTIEPAKTTAQ